MGDTKSCDMSYRTGPGDGWSHMIEMMDGVLSKNVHVTGYKCGV